MEKFGILLLVILGSSWVADSQMSTDRKLCGGYMRETRDHIDFTWNENTAPPEVAQTNKFCVWTVTPTVPTPQFRYNITIRNVNLDCNTSSITINFFNETSDLTELTSGTKLTPVSDQNPITCVDNRVTWRRENVYATTFVVVLHVDQVHYGQGFYMEWEEAFDSRITPGGPRNTYYSFGKPSMAPNPYFAAGFLTNEISTFAFVKGNYSTGFTMEMYFSKISFCEGQADWKNCFNNTMSLYSFADNGTLELTDIWHGETFNETDVATTARSSNNGFFIIVKTQNTFGAGARFTMLYDTVRG